MPSIQNCQRRPGVPRRLRSHVSLSQRGSDMMFTSGNDRVMSTSPMNHHSGLWKCAITSVFLHQPRLRHQTQPCQCQYATQVISCPLTSTLTCSIGLHGTKRIPILQSLPLMGDSRTNNVEAETRLPWARGRKLRTQDAEESIL